MIYTALTPIMFGSRQDRLVNDHRPHSDWVALACADWWRGVEVPEQVRADIVVLLDAAAERALLQAKEGK